MPGLAGRGRDLALVEFGSDRARRHALEFIEDRSNRLPDHRLTMV
jgi:hypothetical protein